MIESPTAESRLRRLSIVIPVFEEAATISEILDQVQGVEIEPLGFEKEIIVCDDGSRDSTAEILEEAARRDPNLKHLVHERNRGKGAAIRTALTEVTGDFVLIQDADLEYTAEDYPALLAPIVGGADAVFGSRFLKARRPEGMRLPNWLANRLLTFTANLLYDHRLTDEATCFKVVRTDLMRSLDLRCERFEFCPEVTAKLGRLGVEIVEVPVRYSARNFAAGKKIRWTDGTQALWVLVKNRLWRPPKT